MQPNTRWLPESTYPGRKYSLVFHSAQCQSPDTCTMKYSYGVGIRSEGVANVVENSPMDLDA